MTRTGLMFTAGQYADHVYRAFASRHRCALTALLACLLLWGCVPYPVYKTLQPAATATIQDGRGEPISDAAVTLISSAYPYGWEKARETKLTTEEGVAAFSARREWRVEMLALHGREVFFWNWCVEKEGFETFSTMHRNAADFRSEPIVLLKAGQSMPCFDEVR